MATRRRGASDDPIEEALRRDVSKAVRGVHGANLALAKHLGVSSVFISEYMSGARKQMGLQHALHTMQWLGWSVDDVLVYGSTRAPAWMAQAQRDPLLRRLLVAMQRITDVTVRTTFVALVESQADAFFERPAAPSPDAAAPRPAPRAAARGKRRARQSRSA
jgi:hypothetical protein